MNFCVVYNKYKFNVDLYWIFKNAIKCCEYNLQFSVFDVIYFIFL